MGCNVRFKRCGQITDSGIFQGQQPGGGFEASTQSHPIREPHITAEAQSINLLALECEAGQADVRAGRRQTVRRYPGVPQFGLQSQGRTLHVDRPIQRERERI